MKTKIQNVEAGPNAASVAKTPLTCTSTAGRAADFVRWVKCRVREENKTIVSAGPYFMNFDFMKYSETY